MIASQLDMKKDSVWKIITEDLGMWKVCAKMVPRLLMMSRRDAACRCVTTSLSVFKMNQTCSEESIASDETWVFEYHLETKYQSFPWKSPTMPRPKKARQSKSKVKVMLITFFDVRGIVHSEFLPQDQTVNQQIYRQSLQRLLGSMLEKREELWQGKLWLLHYDNAPAHDALILQQFMAKKKIAMLEQPPNSPDLAPCDFFLFPKLKRVIKGTHLKTWRSSK